WTPRPQTMSRFPYTTLFRSRHCKYTYFSRNLVFAAVKERPNILWVPALSVLILGLIGRILVYPYTSFTKLSKVTSLIFKLAFSRSEEHTSELQSRENLVCRL